MNNDDTTTREPVEQAGYLFDPNEHAVTDPDGITVQLTPRQFRVALETMGDVFTTYSEISERVRASDEAETIWENDEVGGTPRSQEDEANFSHPFFNGVTLRVTIHNIRQRFENAGARDPIEDRVSFGYRAAKR